MDQSVFRKHAIGALLALLASGASAQVVTHVETQAGAPAVDGTTQTEELGFRADSVNRMTVPVTVVGKGPFRFLVDTGADRTVVSERMASGLKLKQGEDVVLHSITGATRGRTASVPSLQFSKRPLSSVQALVLDDRHVGADGVLGTDSLRSQRVVFDFKRNILSITPAAKTIAREEKGTIVVRARARSGRLIVTNAVVDGKSVAVIIDTGSQVTIGNAALRKAMLGSRPSASSIAVEVLSVTGEKLPGEINVVKELRLGEVTLHDLNIVYSDAHTFRQLGMDKRPAILLGMNAMRAFDLVSIDFAAKRMRVLLPAGTAVDDGTALASRARKTIRG